MGIEKLRAELREAAVRRFQLKWVQFFLSIFFRGGTQMLDRNPVGRHGGGSRDTHEAAVRRRGGGGRERRCSLTSAGVRRAPEPSLQCGCTVRNSSGPGRTPALGPPAGRPATSAGEWAGEAVGTVPHGTSHVLVGTKFTGHRSVRRAVGCKRAVGGGATVAVLGRNGGGSGAHCG